MWWILGIAVAVLAIAVVVLAVKLKETRKSKDDAILTALDGVERGKQSKLREETEKLQIDVDTLNQRLDNLLGIKNGLQHSIDDKEKELRDVENDLARRLEAHRVVVDVDESGGELWEIELTDNEVKLIELLRAIEFNYPVLCEDIANIEWRRVWWPKLQGLANANQLNRSGIYRLALKEDEKVCYIGQAVNIKDRWYEHAKKMVGAMAKGNEKLYKYKPEDFKWGVVQFCDGDELDDAESYWIKWFNSVELGLNKKRD